MEDLHFVSIEAWSTMTVPRCAPLEGRGPHPPCATIHATPHLGTDSAAPFAWDLKGAASAKMTSTTAVRNFVLQQGSPGEAVDDCDFRFAGLMFQPRLIGLVVLVGLVLQAWPVFLCLSALLWWNVALPRWNPFDILYNRLVAERKSRSKLEPAVGPRRLAQAMAATTTLGVAVSLMFEWRMLAWCFEALVLAALTSLLVGKLCIGSYLFHALRGDVAFANRTLPWARG
jgi:hypothetical protein